MVQSKKTQGTISSLAEGISERLRNSINSIKQVNDDIHVLSINAKIQAAKAGIRGNAFSVVADQIRGMVSRTQRITESLQSSVESTVSELMELNSHLGTQVRGERLSQSAENMIDIIDRNLYERTCDVRWWATESAVSDAVKEKTEQNLKTCSKRLGLILDSYTVYYDLVVCDLEGKILANGRPDQYSSTGLNVWNSQWFQTGKNTADGTEYGFEGVHKSHLVNDQEILAYSCGIRENGDPRGKLLGVLGILFNWKGLGEIVARNTGDMLKKETDHPLITKIVCPQGNVLVADNQTSPTIEDNIMNTVRREPRGTLLPKKKGDILMGFASSKGFETYKTGWYALVEEQH